MKSFGKLLTSTLVVTMLLIFCMQAALAAVEIKIAYQVHEGLGMGIGYEDLIKEFNASQDKIKAIPDPATTGNYFSIVLSRMAGGNPPDVIWWSTNGMPVLFVQDALLDLTPYMKKDNFDLSDFFPTSLEGYIFNERYYGLPWESTSKVVGYNKDFFDAAGVEYPSENWNWDDMLAMARKLVKRNPLGKAEVFGITGFFGFFEKTTSFWPIVWSNGAELFDKKDFPAKVLLTSKESINAATFVKDLRFKYKVTPLVGEQTRLNGEDYLIAGESAMAFTSSGITSKMKKAGSKFNWDIQVYPRGTKGRGAGGNALGITSLKSTKHPDAVWEFLKFMTSKETLLKYDKILGGGTIPPRISAAKEILSNYPEKSINATALIQAMTYARSLTYRCLPSYEPWEQFDQAVGNIWGGTMDVLPAFKQVEPVINSKLNKMQRELKKYFK